MLPIKLPQIFMYEYFKLVVKLELLLSSEISGNAIASKYLISLVEIHLESEEVHKTSQSTKFNFKNTVEKELRNE